MTLINWIIKQIKKYNALRDKYKTPECCGTTCCLPESKWSSGCG